MNTATDQHNILKGYSMLLYFAGSMVMYEPNEECFVDFWKNGILKKLPVYSRNPNFILAAAQLTESCKDNNLCTKSMRDDFIRLFGRKELQLAPPFESSYSEELSGKSDSEPARVTRFYSSYGWVSKFRDQVRDDHIGVELFFLTLLIEKYLTLEDEACRTEMRLEVKRYIDNHILSWVKGWNSIIQDEAKTLCYKGIGSLVVACTEDIYSLMTNPLQEFTDYQNLKN
jgi:putative dimethyl sulfoxide reductase chaperone